MAATEPIVVSDLHLSAGYDAAFERFLGCARAQGCRLLVLGDLLDLLRVELTPSARPGRDPPRAQLMRWNDDADRADVLPLLSA